MNNVWLTLRDAESPVLYRNPDAELPARFVMSIGDALPTTTASVALPARTITITKGNELKPARFLALAVIRVPVLVGAVLHPLAMHDPPSRRVGVLLAPIS
jgi:hypothetical protein